MAKVKIVLTKSVVNVGEPGDVAIVAGGYARNYLIPRGLAVPGTKGNVNQAETWRRSKVLRQGREQAAAQEVKAKLESGPLRVAAQAGPDGRLFGSVTAPQVAAAIKSSYGVEVARHDVQIEEPIRHLGFHEVKVRVRAELSATVTIEVIEQ
jgi:large subunit ribosomal protein L9